MSFNQRGWIPSLIALAGAIIMVTYAYVGSLASGQRSLESARDLWEQNKPLNYQYVVEVSCFCPEDYTRPVVVQVQNGFYFNAEGSGGPVSDSYIAQFGSVEALFAIIEKAYKDRADEVLVEYDPTYGVPLRFSLDPIKNAIDDELSVTVTDFTISDLDGE